MALIYIGLKLFTIYKFHTEPWIYWFLFYLFHHFFVVFVVSSKLSSFESNITFSFPIKKYLWDTVPLFSIVSKLNQGFSFLLTYVFLNDYSSILKSLVIYFSWMPLMLSNIMTFTYMHMCVLCHFNHVLFFVTLWTIALQALLSMGFSRQEYWSGLLSPLPRGFPHP